MYPNNDTFTLFGVRTFESFINEKFIAISNHIENISDTVILSYENALSDKIKEIASKFILSTPQINFSKDSVIVTPFLKDISVQDPFFGQKLVPRAFIKYSIPILGKDFELLKVCPYTYLQTKIRVEINNNNLEFILDTRYASIDFSESKIREINTSAIQVKDFITNTLKDLNTSVVKFNVGLDDFISPRLTNRIIKIKQYLKNKQNLNPF